MHKTDGLKLDNYYKYTKKGCISHWICYDKATKTIKKSNSIQWGAKDGIFKRHCEIMWCINCNS